MTISIFKCISALVILSALAINFAIGIIVSAYITVVKHDPMALPIMLICIYFLWIFIAQAGLFLSDILYSKLGRSPIIYIDSERFADFRISEELLEIASISKARYFRSPYARGYVYLQLEAANLPYRRKSIYSRILNLYSMVTRFSAVRDNEMMIRLYSIPNSEIFINRICRDRNN